MLVHVPGRQGVHNRGVPFALYTSTCRSISADTQSLDSGGPMIYDIVEGFGLC